MTLVSLIHQVFINSTFLLIFSHLQLLYTFGRLQAHMSDSADPVVL